MALQRPMLRPLGAPMGLHPHGHDLVPFATPGNRDIYYPGGFRGQRFMPFGHAGQYLLHPGRNPYRAADPTGVRGLASLKDKTLETTGDLGWTVDYATAWLYRHLTNSRPDVADAIDHVRDSFDTVGFHEAFLVFDLLDTTIFGSKLKGMVYLRWTLQPSCSPGRTSAPNVIPGIPRICIQLNEALFDDGNGDIDELLEVLIHQMIHAYFLVCCGAQKRGDQADGRLEDGKHFAVILMAIRGISKECEEGELELIFHASKRRQRDMGVPPRGPAAMGNAVIAGRTRDPYLAINPAGDNIGLGLVDNQTNCMRDNRHVTPADVQNWQMRDLSKSLELDMEAKGEKIWDFGEDGTLVEMDRVKCPPSVSYIEMLWEDRGLLKRVMAKREKALEYRSLEKPLLKHDRFELKVPHHTHLDTFKCVWDYISKGAYCATPLDRALHWPATRGDGPPVLYREQHHGIPAAPDTSILTHIKVFKTAESMKFAELQLYAIQHMWNVPATHENPIALLRELYNLEQDPIPGPINAELHRWARSFLARRERHGHDRYRAYHPGYVRYAGYSNVAKIHGWYREHFMNLFHTSQAFRDDLQQAQLMIITGTGDAFAARRPVGIAARHHFVREAAAVAPLAIGNGPALGGGLLDGGIGIGLEPALPLPDLGGLNLNPPLAGAGLGLGLGGLGNPVPGLVNPLGGLGAGAGLDALNQGPGLNPFMPI